MSAAACDDGQRMSEIAVRQGMCVSNWLIADIGLGLRASSSGVSRARLAYAMVEGMLTANIGRMNAMRGKLLGLETMKSAVAIWNPAYARMVLRNSECASLILWPNVI